MEYCDFHTHLDWYEDSLELENQLSGFKGTIIAASVDEKSFKKNLALAEKIHSQFSDCCIIPTFGIHPEKVPFVEESLSFYDEFCNQSPIIGEIGMDFCWYKEASPKKQEEVLRYFLHHCNNTKKFCVIHTKNAEQKILELLDDYSDVKPIIHWYDGPESVFAKLVERNCYFTFGCETIRSVKIQEFLKTIPQNLILAETDNPTAEPWLGGKDNSVFLIKRIYSDIAEILGLSENKTAEIINENSRRIVSAALNTVKIL